MKKIKSKSDYVTFDLADYADNPIALARIKADITQEGLAKRMKVTQAYISKIEFSRHGYDKDSIFHFLRKNLIAK